jgi:hypothetical protein
MDTIPVLVIGFNRPDLLNNLLLRLQQLKITRVFVALDGPRSKYDFNGCNDSLKVTEKFKTIFDLQVLWRDYNLGCTLGVISALDWFFSEVNFGAILEDDCYPELDVFEHFHKLIKINPDQKTTYSTIASGHNPFICSENILASKYTLIWGWASWSIIYREIRKNFFELNKITRTNVLGETRNLKETVYWWVNATRARLGFLDTWDGIFSDQAWRLGYKCLIPEKNLIKNYGFRQDATHTKNSGVPNLVYFSNSKITEKNFDSLLVKNYFKIRNYHVITSILKLVFEILRNKRQKNFESVLSKDKLLRKIIK